MEPLIERVEIARLQLAADVAGMDPGTPLELDLSGKGYAERPYSKRKGAVLVHVMAETEAPAAPPLAGGSD